MRKLLFLVVALVSAVLPSSCALLPFGPGGVIYYDNNQQADVRMEQVAAAVNSQDAAALKGLFSTPALEEATGFDEGLDYFLSYFPNGGLTWERDAVGSEGSNLNGKKTELLLADYKVSADGEDYWLFFADFTVNQTSDPESAGLYALGVTPWTEDIYCTPAEPFAYWAGAIHWDRNGKNGYPGIYVPEGTVPEKGEQADARMEQIAAAMNSDDAAALKGLFSPRALEQATGFDEGLDSLFSSFPDGGLTWERSGVGCSGNNSFGKRTVVLWSSYNVSADGEDQELFFAEYTVNEVDPEDVGLYALGATPSADPDEGFGSWASSWSEDGYGDPGIYVATG